MNLYTLGGQVEEIPFTKQESNICVLGHDIKTAVNTATTVSPRNLATHVATHVHEALNLHQKQ